MFKYFCLVASFFLSLHARVIAEVGTAKVLLNDFQEYVNVQKFIANEKSFDTLVKEKNTSKDQFLSDFLDQKILSFEAEKKGINIDTPFVKSQYERNYLERIRQIYILKKVNFANNKITESEIKKVYRKYGKGNSKPFNSLNKKEKSQLIQFALLDKLKISKEKYKKQLIKKYKVSKKNTKAKVVANVGSRKITQSDLTQLMKKYLGGSDLELKKIEENNPKRYSKMLKDSLEELIFNALVEKEMKESSFLNKPIVKEVLATYKKQLAIKHFIVREIISRFEITPADLDDAFKELSKIDSSIKQLLPSEQEGILKKFILQRKQPEILASYLNRKREEILIKRNKELLKEVI